MQENSFDQFIPHSAKWVEDNNKAENIFVQTNVKREYKSE